MCERIFPLLLTLALLLLCLSRPGGGRPKQHAVFYSDGETIIRRESSL